MKNLILLIYALLLSLWNGITYLLNNYIAGTVGLFWLCV